MSEAERKDLYQYRISKAVETLNEVDSHIQNKLWNTAVNRIYYGCYYAVTALLIKNGFFSKTHSGVRQLFGLHFIKTALINKELGKFYSDIFDLRQSGDYDDFVYLKQEEVMALVEPSRQLIITIQKLLGD